MPIATYSLKSTVRYWRLLECHSDFLSLSLIILDRYINDIHIKSQKYINYIEIEMEFQSNFTPFCNCLEPQASTLQAYALQFVLDQRPGYDWLMWFDCDLIIDASQDQDLASLLAQHGVTSATEMLISADGWGIQPDLILLRASDWSRGFLENFACKMDLK